MPAPTASNGNFDPATCQCEACKLARFESSKLRHAVVRSYSYQPARWNMKAQPGEVAPYFLGVELETDNYSTDSNGYRQRATLSNEQAADARRPKRHWMAKRDGSVSGPEFVSHPATLAWWKAHKSDLAEMFQMLVHGGFRSHDNDHAGMHVNISRNAFADSRHLFRFLTLLHSDTRFALRMSQRTESSARQWASLESLAAADRRQQEVNTVMPDEHNNFGGYGTAPMNTYYQRSSNRYQALNTPGVTRFEFRLPRGTLRVDRFYKNLEWTAAMIEFSRTGTVAQMNTAAFGRFVDDHRTEYPYLHGFMVEKGYLGAAPASEARARRASATPATNNGVRISPRTGRPVRQYNRRPGARRPGRPDGFSPRRTPVDRAGYVFPTDHNGTMLEETYCMSRDDRVNGTGYYCEREPGHTGEHAALPWRAVADRAYWPR